MARTLLLLLLAVAVAAPALAVDTPRLLLNAQRLRRLRRDRDRKTTRWINFENRVNNVPDSPERGFELALYYLISGDESRGNEAVLWATNHRDARTAALVLDWCAPLLSAEDRQKLAALPAEAGTHFAGLRDRLFLQIATTGTAAPPSEDVLRKENNWFIESGTMNADQIYALCEFILTARAAAHVDIRESEATFYRELPRELILGVKPRELELPDWKRHIAALALVAVDPNLPASQFLQSWAMEERQMVTDGPGVAYELLWADPYLPGVGYQNMENWLFDDHGRLYARNNWDASSCWVEISPQGVHDENCPPNWQHQTAVFGHLTLIPFDGKCVEVPHLPPNEVIATWKLRPGQKVTYGKGKDQGSGVADPAGVWRPGPNVEGKACLAAH